MTIREATADDLPLVRELWQEFEREVPDHAWRDDDLEADLAALERRLHDDVVLLADEVGLAVACRRGERLGFLDLVYVRPRARRGGVAAALVREVAARLRAQGMDTLDLQVLASNDAARAVYERWGMATVELLLAAPLEQLERRLETTPEGPTFGTIHVQTDDAGDVERTVAKVLPRLARGAEHDVQGRGDWVRVRSDATDADPTKLQALAKELSYALASVVLSLGVERGAVVRYNLYDRGSDVDEYLSVPEFEGPLPPGDVIALGANPTVVARLTGADPHRVREIARTASSPGELPPAEELYRQIAELMRVEVD